MIEGINHIAIAVTDIDEAVKLYESIFGIELEKREYVEAYGVETATFKLGDTEIELLEGKTEDSSISKYVKKNGPGIHHIAFTVANIEEAMATLKPSVKFINEDPSKGKDDSRVAFLHPSSTRGILYELVEPRKK